MMRAAAVLLLLLAAGLRAQQAPPQINFFLFHPAYLFDLDCNGIIDASDFNVAIAQALGTKACTTGDFDGSKTCDVVDVVLLVLAYEYGGKPYYPLGPYIPWCRAAKGL